MALTNTQIRALARDHAFRVIDNMDIGALIDYATDQLADSFDVDIDYLTQDIVDYEGGDLDSASEFLIGAGFTNEEADDVLKEFGTVDRLSTGAHI